MCSKDDLHFVLPGLYNTCSKTRQNMASRDENNVPRLEQMYSVFKNVHWLRTNLRRMYIVVSQGKTTLGRHDMTPHVNTCVESTFQMINFIFVSSEHHLVILGIIECIFVYNLFQNLLLALISGLIWFQLPYKEESIVDRYSLVGYQFMLILLHL